MGMFSTHAQGTNDPPEVRNWTIHLVALVASMSALASMSPFNQVRHVSLIHMERKREIYKYGSIQRYMY